MSPIPEAIQHFRAYLQRRNYATHTLDSYTLDLQLFFAAHRSSRFIASHFVRSIGLSITSINKD